MTNRDPTSILSQKLMEAVAKWGGRPRPRRTRDRCGPWSGISNTLKAKADEGVGRGHCA